MKNIKKSNNNLSNDLALSRRAKPMEDEAMAAVTGGIIPRLTGEDSFIPLGVSDEDKPSYT